MSLQSDVARLQKIIDESNNIVFFGGAGVSTASGIPDFRSEQGLYNSGHKFKYPPEKILSRSFFNEHTKEFFDFYKSTMCVTDCEPNITHYKLAELEKQGKLKAVITQNIDGLHQKAGSKNVLELHGSIYKNYCLLCKKQFSVDYVKNSADIPYCDSCNNEYAVVKPLVVLYEEPLPTKIFNLAYRYVSMADTLIIAGTSLTVYPAANLINYFYGKHIVLINKGAITNSANADLIINDDMTKIFEQIH